MKLITEHTENVKYFSESVGSNGEKKFVIEGIFMQAEQLNRNSRIYPKSVLESAVDRYVTNYVNKGRAVGELNHPESPSINLDKVSHRITNLSWDGNDVIGKALILNTPMGVIVKGLLEGGCQLGVSSRGMGTVDSKNGKTTVNDDFVLSTVDIVQDPSAPSAFVNGIMESVDWVYDGTNFVANKIDAFAETLKQIKKQKTSVLYTESLTKEFTNLLKSF
jgi:hypothetical protein